MNVTPTPKDEETAAIVAAMLRDAAPGPAARADADSRWRDTARREGVLTTVPSTWRP